MGPLKSDLRLLAVDIDKINIIFQDRQTTISPLIFMGQGLYVWRVSLILVDSHLFYFSHVLWNHHQRNWCFIHWIHSCTVSYINLKSKLGRTTGIFLAWFKTNKFRKLTFIEKVRSPGKAGFRGLYLIFLVLEEYREG